MIFGGASQHRLRQRTSGLDFVARLTAPSHATLGRFEASKSSSDWAEQDNPRPSETEGEKSSDLDREYASRSPLRICEVSPYGLTRVSGISTMILSLAAELGVRGHQTILVVPGPLPKSLPFGVTAWAIDIEGPLRNLRLGLRVAFCLWKRRKDWDVVHCHQAHPVSAIASLVARVLRRPAVSTFHLWPPPASGFRGLSQSFFNRFQPMIGENVYVSEDTRHGISGLGSVIWNGVDGPLLRARLGDRNKLRGELGIESFALAFTGRKAKIKGYLDLLVAVRKLLDLGVDTRLIVTGDASPEEFPFVQDSIRQLHLEPFVIDLGDRDDHLRYLSAADVMVLPSYREGFPMVLLEAMAAGIPVVASDVGGIPELVQDTQDGFLVSPGNVEKLVATLLQLALHPEIRERMAGAAVQRAAEFSLDREVSSYLQLFGRSPRR